MHDMTFVKLCVSGDAWTLAQKLVCMCDYVSLIVNDFCRAWEHTLRTLSPTLEDKQWDTSQEVAIKVCKLWGKLGKGGKGL